MQQTDQEIDWSGLSMIRREPGKMGGVPNIAGMRITPETIVDNYEGGISIWELVTEHFPGVIYDQAWAILDYVSKRGQLERPLEP